jgi:hypothetical protein
MQDILNIYTGASVTGGLVEGNGVGARVGFLVGAFFVGFFVGFLVGFFLVGFLEIRSIRSLSSWTVVEPSTTVAKQNDAIIKANKRYWLQIRVIFRSLFFKKIQLSQRDRNSSWSFFVLNGVFSSCMYEGIVWSYFIFRDYVAL